MLLDAWWNSEVRTGLNGQLQLFHYKWAEQSDPGYYFFGQAFLRYGARLRELPAEPTARNLRNADVYLIVSPDTKAKTPSPHFMNQKAAKAIVNWVRSGGVLLIFENDPYNAEITHFNLLSDRFGIHFNCVRRNHVLGKDYAEGALHIPAGAGNIFSHSYLVYMKDICTIRATAPAKAILTQGGDTLMAVAHVGKGTVWAVTDPWFYNEYTDGRKLPPIYQNFSAAINLAGWALARAR